MQLEEFLINLLLSSATAAFVSGLLTHYLQMRFFKAQSEAGYIQAKLRLYSLILFYMEKMRLTGKVLGRGKESYMFTKEEIEQIVTDLNEAIKERLDLLNPEALKYWLELQVVLYEKPAVPRINKLRELILQEYNNDIIPKYQEIVGKEPRKLEYCSELTD